MDELSSNVSINIQNVQYIQMNTTIQTQNQYHYNTLKNRKISHKTCKFREKRRNEQNLQVKIVQSIGKLSNHEYNISCKYAPITFKFHKQANSVLFKEYVEKFYQKSFEKIFLQNKKMEASLNPSSSFIEKNESSQQIGLKNPKKFPYPQSQNQLQNCQLIKEESIEKPLQLLTKDQEQELRSQNIIGDTQSSCQNSQLIYQTMIEYLNKIKQQFHNIFSFNFTSNNDNQTEKNIQQPSLNAQTNSFNVLDMRLPAINLKSDEKQKFTDQINKIFKNFLNRDKQIRNSNISLSREQQNTYIQPQNNEEEEIDKKTFIDSYDCEDDDDSEDKSERNNENIANQEFDIRSKQENIKEKCKETMALQNNNYDCEYEYNQKYGQIQQLSTTEISKSTATITSLVLTQNKQSEICGGQSAREVLSQQTITVKPEQYLSSLKIKRTIPTNSCTSSQSKYHNLKNSFMHLIISLFNQKVLSCFDIPQKYIDYSIQIIKRMKNNSFKYRPIKGRYQYYSNIHYSTLFLKLMNHNLNEVKSCKQNLSYHEIFFQENLANCKEMYEFSALKCQIVLFSLEVAQKNLAQYNEENNNKYLKSSRYFYINKVKKGIQKLQKGKHVIRF